MLHWEAETGQEYSADDWQDMLSNMHRGTKWIVVKETVVKLHIRLHYTPVRLHTMYPLVPDTCFRGCTDRGTHLHIFWSCKTIKPLWQQASIVVSLITGSIITLTFPICLFFADLPEIPPFDQRLVHILFSHIHWSIALTWRSPSVPWFKVMQRMELARMMESIHHTVYGYHSHIQPQVVCRPIYS